VSTQRKRGNTIQKRVVQHLLFSKAFDKFTSASSTVPKNLKIKSDLKQTDKNP
jgi:hypothetical protein